MPKATRGNDSPTPKRNRKTSPKKENGAHPENGNGAAIAPPVTAASAMATDNQAMPPIEEKIRVRAYEIYLERGGDGGSPEQDWFRAMEEICGRQPSA